MASYRKILIPIEQFCLKFDGALAQLVERNNGIVEVIGSNPLRSIFLDNI